MKNVALLFVAVVALACATTASAGEHAAAAQPSVSADMLSTMGMGGMKLLSDEQGMQIRGQGKTRVTAWNISIIHVDNVGKLNIKVVQTITVKAKKH
jgi:hypothetical protein